jgi:hypothetical protein
MKNNIVPDHLVDAGVMGFMHYIFGHSVILKLLEK